MCDTSSTGVGYNVTRLNRIALKLLYSSVTVTDLARFLGWSTLNPRWTVRW
jgi:hypothetical protein